MTPELEKKIEEAADNHHYFGINAPIGSRNRANFEQKKESFIAGAKSDAAKNYWQKGMYTEEEVLALFENWLNTKINEELMVISGELDCLEGVIFSDWFERNKKK